MSTKIKHPDGSMGYVVHGIFGENAERVVSNAKNNKSITRQLKKLGLPELFKTFSTEAEANAYQEGLADMDGWFGVYLTTPTLHNAIFGFKSLQVLSNNTVPCIPADDPEEIALLASIMTFNLIEEIEKSALSTSCVLMDLIPSAALSFYSQYGHVEDWAEFIETELKGGYTCFEELVIDFGRKFLSNNL